MLTSSQVSPSRATDHVPLGARPVVGGLCVNCLDEPSCLFLARATAPVCFCEEHQIPCDTKACVDEGLAPAERIPASFTGLCETCESSHNCSLTSTPRGVWHCEEFR